MASTDQAECMSIMFLRLQGSSRRDSRIDRISSFNDAEPPFHCSGVVAEAE